jgi:RND family efflux transporter MFP subunit
MKTKKRIVYIIISLVLIAIVAMQLMNNKESAEQRIYHYNKDKAVNVQADTIKLQEGTVNRSFAGTFEPVKETQLAAEVQGKINKVYVDLGSTVIKGQDLIQLDNSLLNLQLESVEVQIEGLKADVKRYGILANADAIQGVQLEKAELGLKSALVQRNTILEQISKTTVKAPFDGIVTAKMTEEGAFAAPGIPLLQLTNINWLKFTVMISENDIRLFNTNQAYQVVADVFPETILSGIINLIGSKSDMGNNFPVQVTVENTPDQKIKSGMFGRLILTNNTDGKQIIIPSSAIVGSTIQPQVYIIKNGKALLHPVTVSKRMENKVVIQKGLNEGDLIVTGGFINLFDGANVHIN